jgi:type II secretory pathway pseudopilin PulG
MQGSRRHFESVLMMDRSITGARGTGFTLIEVALAIFIMGLLLAGVVLPLQAQLEVRMNDETHRLLDEAREALLGYAAMNGHFPCPATPASNGWEPASAQIRRDSDPEITPTCDDYTGFLPAAELGLANLSQGFAVDGAGEPENRIRYAVSNAALGVPTPVPDTFVVEAGMQSVGIDMLGSMPLLHVCAGAASIVAGVSCGPAANTITDRAVVVVWSVGPNARTGGTSADEAENPNPNNPGPGDRIFVSRPRSGSAGPAFDDVVVWIPLPLIVNRLVAAGHLP